MSRIGCVRNGRALILLVSLLLSLVSTTRALPAAREQDHLAQCTAHLQRIGRALDAYRHDHGDLPDQLSDLIPRYLADKSLLHCPADTTPGDLRSTEAHVDSHIPISYSYERSVDESNGLACPLGKFPTSDLPGKPWGSWRHVNGYQMTFFGDQVPVVRCFHHRPSETQRDAGQDDDVLTLTFSGKVYHSAFRWDKTPASMAAVLQNFDHDLHALTGAELLQKWNVWRVREYTQDIDPHTDMTLYKASLRSIADRIAEILPALPDEQRVASEMAAAFYINLRQSARALPLLDIAAKYPGAEWSPIVEDQMRANAYHGLKQYDKEVAVYQSLLARRPDVRPYMLSLADVYEATGQKAKAQEWRDKADPGALLVGKPAPDFTVNLLDGNTFHLKEALHDHKAVLVNFWFCGCAPCRREFPHLQAWHTQFKTKGLELVSVNSSDTAENVHQFVEEGHYTFKIGLGRNPDRSANSVFDAYHVLLYPTSFLIDSTGKIVWRGIGLDPDLLKALPHALAQLGVK